MLFNSGTFFWFFTVVYGLYRVLPHRAQNWLLLAASYVFYGWWDVRFLLLLGASTLIDYVSAIAMERARERGDLRRARVFLTASIIGNLGMLATFKYHGFFAASARGALESLGVAPDPFTLAVILPVGISFYTFQTLGYTLDVYARRSAACRNFPDFALFVAFFPQLLAGPIERARDLLPQIQQPRRVTRSDLAEAGWLVFWGLFKKVFIADNLAPFTRWGTGAGSAVAGVDAYLVLIAFCLQFYCDFSGYSDMARGLARLLGIQLHANFRLPYFAANPADLWSRWHITLGAWFRDHVHARLVRLAPGPLGEDAALLLTMTLVGLWHGAQWRFVIWGMGWGALLVVHRRWRRVRAVAPRSDGPMLRTALAFVAPLLVFHVWGLLGVFFVASDVPHALNMQARLLGNPGVTSATTGRDALTLLFFAAPLLLVETAQLVQGRLDAVFRWPALCRGALYALLVVLLVTAGSSGSEEFLYFAF